MAACWSRLGPTLGLAVALWAQSAHAEPLPLDLEWHAPEECPSVDEVRVELERIAHVNAEREPTPLVARARIQRVQNGYFLELFTLKDGQVGKKKLFAKSCASLKEAATLVLALAFGDGVEVTDEGAPNAARDAQTAPAPAPRVAVPLVARPSVPREPLHYSPWISGLVNFGLLGSTAGGARAGLGVFERHFGVELRGSLLLPASVPRVNNVGASFNALSAALAGCMRSEERPLRVSACAGLEAAAIHGVSAGATRNLEATARHFSAVPSLALTLPVLRPLAVRAEADLGIALDRPEFFVSSVGTLLRVPELSGSLGLGIEVEL
jgi:hypothetical protein